MVASLTPREQSGDFLPFVLSNKDYNSTQMLEIRQTFSNLRIKSLSCN